MYTDDLQFSVQLFQNKIRLIDLTANVTLNKHKKKSNQISKQFVYRRNMPCTHRGRNCLSMKVLWWNAMTSNTLLAVYMFSSYWSVCLHYPNERTLGLSPMEKRNAWFYYLSHVPYIVVRCTHDDASKQSIHGWKWKNMPIN